MLPDVTTRIPGVFLFRNRQGTGYVEGDPINFYDPTGLQAAEAGREQLMECPTMGGMLMPGSMCPNPPSSFGSPKKHCADGSVVDEGITCPEEATSLRNAFGGETARGAVARDECAKTLGARNGQEAVRRFDSTQFRYVYDQGLPTALRSGNGLRLAPEAFIARAYEGGPIELNGHITAFSYGGFDRMAVRVVNEGNATDLFDFRAAMAAQLGESISDTQMRVLILLHEFGHALGMPQETTFQYNQNIFTNCIKGFIQ